MTNILKGLDVQYIAGFFDAEGYATIIRQKKNNKPFYYVKTTITNTNIEVIERLQSVFGGKIYADPPKEKHWKVCYYLYFYTQDALKLLRAIKPLVIVKKALIEKIIEFDELRNKWGVHSGIRYTKDQLTILENYYIAVKKLNSKTKKKES
jgi:LAGLIDADG endonuclease